MWEKILDQNIERFGRSKEERETQWEEFVSKIPLGRPQELEDVANLAAFLCSPLASNMTGQAINLTGGSFMN
jgi:NAD(P)-dependent dehydrogenase (short-subunit alcohol dehydrogenase family)